MATTANSLATPTLSEIAAAQAKEEISAFDRSYPARRLARLQHLYAQRRAEQDLLAYLFDEGTPELTLRGQTQRLTVCGDVVNEIYQTLGFAVDSALRKLEADIVLAHQEVAQWDEDNIKDYANKVDYVPHILALCQPTAPLATALPGPPSLIPQTRQAA